MTQKSAKQQIQAALGTFNVIANFLQFSLIVLGTASVLGTLGVATFSKELEEKGFLKPVAYIAAASSALIMQFSLQRKSSDARTAWRLLHIALLKNAQSPDEFGEEQLIESYSEAEILLGHIIFAPPTPLVIGTTSSQTSQTPQLRLEPKNGQVKFGGKIDLKIVPSQVVEVTKIEPSEGKVDIKSDSIIEYAAPQQAANQSDIEVTITVKSKTNQKEAVATLKIVK